MDAHLPNDQPFHTFGTFRQSESNLQKCDPCFRTWNRLADLKQKSERQCGAKQLAP